MTGIGDGAGYSPGRFFMQSSKPNSPDIPGIELTENYCDCSVAREEFINQRALIPGKGTSAFETTNVKDM